ncbi:MAG: phosphoenolpyruvate carboxylase [Candidatus Gracilibacteria bacterium]
MATQHPDNASPPFWLKEALINTKMETEEVFRSFSEMGCDEQMWDWEGKFADESMIERLIAGNQQYFRKNQIGKDNFITVRIPNIWEEKTFKLGRAYMSILSAAEFTKSLKLNAPPVFELILPMTKSASQLIHIQKTFQKTARVYEKIFGQTKFGAGYIQIIPLFESVDNLANCGRVMKEYLRLHKAHFKFYPKYLRVFIARSDPALNAGFVPAVLAVRIALKELEKVSAEFGVKIFPIIGTGSLPFRGGINPENITHSLSQYRGASTVTIQSAFRYDYPLEQVKKALKYIKRELGKKQTVQFSEEENTALKNIIKIFQPLYKKTIEKMAPFINELAAHIPARRERVQHVGLFGYNRGVGKVKLPRAISFTGACYSAGIPPEFIGTGRGLEKAKKLGLLPLLKKHFITLEWELKHAGKFFNAENLEKLEKDNEWAREIKKDMELCKEILKSDFGPQKEHHFLHRNLTSNIMLKRSLGEPIESDIVEAAKMRKSLG